MGPCLRRVTTRGRRRLRPLRNEILWDAEEGLHSGEAGSGGAGGTWTLDRSAAMDSGVADDEARSSADRAGGKRRGITATPKHHADKRGNPGKTRSLCRLPDGRPHPLVDPGNPPHSPTSRAKTNSTCRHHRMVALAAGSSSRSTEISYQTKITAVMLGRVDKPIDARIANSFKAALCGGQP